jgi:chromate transporter
MTTTLGEAARIWLKVGLIGFGGPAGQIALMHRIAVDEHRWIAEKNFLAALNFCMLLPGPEAQQLAVYLGWRLHGTVGGLIAGTLFVLPGAVIMLGLSLVYVYAQNVAAVDGLLFGLKAAVLAVVVEAIFRIGRRAIKSPLALAVAVVSFIAIFFLAAPFPLIIAAAAVLGALAAPKAAAVMAASDGGDRHRRPPPRLTGWRRIAVIAAAGLPLWLGPVAVCMIFFGTASSFVAIGAFFAKMAVVTFGGAYAVLSYVAQAAVETYGWLGPDEMLAGLGLAETTPGPLILVVQFVAFLGGFRDPAPFAPLGGGVFASLIAGWVTFVPSFLWIFAGAPFIEKLVATRRLGGALAMVTAAVVGVVANLALWFALHVIFTDIEQHPLGVLRVLVPDAGSIDLAALVLCAGALIAMLRFGVGMLTTLAGCAGLGLAVRLAT